MQALQVTLFSDGRPGHEKQSLGIIRALQAYVEVEVTKVEVPTSTSFADLVSHLFLFFRTGNTGHSETSQNTDLFIGTGSRTHLPMLSARHAEPALQPGGARREQTRHGSHQGHQDHPCHQRGHDASSSS